MCSVDTDRFHVLSVILPIIISNLFEHFVYSSLAESALVIVRYVHFRTYVWTHRKTLFVLVEDWFTFICGSGASQKF